MHLHNEQLGNLSIHTYINHLQLITSLPLKRFQVLAETHLIPQDLSEVPLVHIDQVDRKTLLDAHPMEYLKVVYHPKTCNAPNCTLPDILYIFLHQKVAVINPLKALPIHTLV